MALLQRFCTRNPVRSPAHAHLALVSAKVFQSALHCGPLDKQSSVRQKNSLLLLNFSQSYPQCLYNVCTICVISQLMVFDKGYMYVNAHYRTYRIYHYSSICCAFTTLSSAGSSLSSESSSESLILDKFTCILATFCRSLAH